MSRFPIHLARHDIHSFNMTDNVSDANASSISYLDRISSDVTLATSNCQQRRRSRREPSPDLLYDITQCEWKCEHSYMYCCLTGYKATPSNHPYLPPAQTRPNHTLTQRLPTEILLESISHLSAAINTSPKVTDKSWTALYTLMKITVAGLPQLRNMFACMYCFKLRHLSDFGLTQR